MARSGPDRQQPVVSLERERENAIELLKDQFAHDHLSLEELEQRLERVYKAASIQAVRDVTRDLATATEATALERRPAPLPEAFAPAEERILSVMGQTRRRGVWQVPRELKVVSVMSETYLDLTEAHLGPGVTEIRLRVLMSSVKIVVPPGVRVVVQPGAFLSEVADETVDPPPVGSGAPVVRLTGRVVMAELKVSVRKRELTRWSDESGDEDF
jgi:hypothetical protein